MPPEEFKGMLGVSNVAHGDDGMPVWNNRFASAHAYGMGWLPNSYMYSAMNMQGYWGCASLTATGHCQGDPAFLGGFGAIHGIHTPIHPAVPAVVTSHTTTTTQHALEPSSGGVTINVHA